MVPDELLKNLDKSFLEQRICSRLWETVDLEYILIMLAINT